MKKTSIVKWLFILLVLPVASRAALVAMRDIKATYFFGFLAALLVVSIISFVSRYFVRGLKVKTFFKWLSIILFTPFVCFVMLLAWIVIAEIYFHIPMPRTDLRFLHIEIQTTPLESERTVYYICGYSTGQKYVIKNGVVQNFYELPRNIQTPERLYDNVYALSMSVESNLRKHMKPYLLLPTRKRINENAPVIIRGRGEGGRNDYLYWSGNIEQAPDDVLKIVAMFDQHVERIAPTNHISFIQGVSQNKNNSNIKRIKSSEFSQAGWSIIYDAIIYNPYRLFIIDQDAPPIPLINHFRPINDNDRRSDAEFQFDIRILPYAPSASDKPPTLF